jgi:hypothetical protein
MRIFDCQQNWPGLTTETAQDSAKKGVTRGILNVQPPQLGVRLRDVEEWPKWSWRRERIALTKQQRGNWPRLFPKPTQQHRLANARFPAQQEQAALAGARLPQQPMQLVQNGIAFE